MIGQGIQSMDLRAHKDSDGYRCYGRRGYLVDEVDE